MNILHLLSRFDSYDAFAEVSELATNLNNKGHNNIIVSSFDPQELKARFPDIKQYNLPPFEANVKDYFVAYKNLKEIIKIDNIDIVHTYSTLGSWLAFLACRHTDKPLVNTCYDFYPKKARNYSLILNNRVIVHSGALGKHLINNHNLPRQRLRFISPCLNLENFVFQDIDQRSKTEFNIGIIAPPRPTREYELFLKAMVKVVRIIPPIKIWLISHRSKIQQNIKDDLQVWVRRLSLTSYVQFFDTSNLSLDFLTKLNVLVFSSFQENANTRPILEAQAYGVPVIATRVGGVADVIADNQTGILVSPQDNNTLVSAITKILKDFSLAREIALSARKRIENEFNLNNNIDSFTEIYKDVKNNVRILMINIGKAPEVVASIPALRIIKELMPQGQVTSLVNSPLRCLLKRCPYIDEFMTYDCDSTHKGLRGFMRLLKLLIKERFDIVFDLNNSFQTHLLAYLCLANQRFGRINYFWDNFLINKGVQKNSKTGELAQDNLQMLTPLGIESKDWKLELWPSPEDIDFADAFLKDSWIGKEKIVGMDLSAKRKFFDESKTSDYLAYLCDKLANQQIRVILMGLKDNLKDKKEFFKKIKSKPILASGDISAIQKACLIKKCDIYISLNQESLYLALAMKIPSIILSSQKNSLDLLKYKNIQMLSTKDFHLGAQAQHKKRHFKQAERKDNVLETISRLIQVK